MLHGSKLVADRFEAGRRPVSNLSATSFEPASVMKFGFCTTTGRRLIYVLVYLHCFTLLITSYLPTQTLVVNCLMSMPDDDWSCTLLGLCVTICWPFQHDSNSNTIYIPEILGHLAKYPNPASLVFVTTLIWYRWHEQRWHGRPAINWRCGWDTHVTTGVTGIIACQVDTPPGWLRHCAYLQQTRHWSSMSLHNPTEW